MNYGIVGADIAKNVMQLHWMDPDTGEIINSQSSEPHFWSTSRIVLLD